MLKMEKLTAVVLIFGLCFWTSLFLGTKSFSDGQEENIINNYDDQDSSSPPTTDQVSHRVIPDPYLDIEVWVDKGEGTTYYPGEKIKVYFKASRDCYAVIYNIDTKGYVNLLYPCDGHDDSYIEGGRTYRIPDRFDDYDLTVDGPEGTEYIQAVASLDPIALPNFPGLSEKYDYNGEIYAYKLDGEDPFEFMETINREIASDDYASEVCIFNVEYRHPRWYYWPREVWVDRPVDVVLGGVYFGYPWDMEVWIDGVFYGITPITIPALVVGRHWVTFWYSGCWMWRDWVFIERGHTVRVWAHCDHRYRHVKERFVEKSYREEKAKRRRGIDETSRSISSPPDRFVKPVNLHEKSSETKSFRRGLTGAEKTRIQETTGGFKKEFRVKEKGEAVKYKNEKPRVIERRQKDKEPNSQFRPEEKKRIEKSTNERPQIKEKRRIEQKDRPSEGKPRSSEIKSIQRNETKSDQVIIKRSELPRAQTKSTTNQTKESRNVQKEHRRR
jgi:hypothetical protein